MRTSPMPRGAPLLGALLVLMTHGCAREPAAAAPLTPQQKLEQRAAEAAERSASDALADNEIRMIAYRRQLMGTPGLQLYVVFLNDMGQPIEYFVTAGKCTSSNKRLSPGWEFQEDQVGIDGDGHAVHGDFVLPRAVEDGTHGASDPYVYCRTADGKYKQWNGQYYISDAPIELTIKPLIVDRSGRTQQQH